MNRITYNKLVRDKIPEIITDSGKTAVIEFLSDGEYGELLDAKLAEELNEYQESRDVEELIDILEVIYSIAKAKGISRSALDRIRKEKAEARGGFKKKILLKEVIDD